MRRHSYDPDKRVTPNFCASHFRAPNRQAPHHPAPHRAAPLSAPPAPAPRPSPRARSAVARSPIRPIFSDIQSLLCTRAMTEAERQVMDQEVHDAIEAMAKGQTKLDLSQKKIGDEDAILLANALAGNSTLQRLDLSRNEIGNRGATAFASALGRNRTLQKLDLADNVIGAAGAAAMASALIENTSLQKLTFVHDNARITSAIHRNRKLYTKSQTPLMKACKEGSLVRVRSAIASGCRINARDSLGMTPLVYACQASDEKASMETVVYLFSQSGSHSCEELGVDKALAHGSAKRNVKAFLEFLKTLPLARFSTNASRSLVGKLCKGRVRTLKEACRLDFSRLAELGIVSAQERQIFAEAFAEGGKNSNLETLAATVAFARKLRGSGIPVLHKMLRPALIQQLARKNALEDLEAFDKTLASIQTQATRLQNLQALVAHAPEKLSRRNRIRENLVKSIRKVLSRGVKDHIAKLKCDPDRRLVVDTCYTLWKDIARGPVKRATQPITFENVQRATEAALKALREWETQYDTSAAHERSLASLRALDASTTNIGIQPTFYMTLMHPEQMPKLRGSIEAVEAAFQSELEVLCAEDPMKNAPRRCILHALSVTLSFYERTIAEKVSRTENTINDLQDRLSRLEPGLKMPDTDRAESLVQDLRDSRKKRKRIVRELEDAKEDADDGDNEARAKLPKLQRELAKIGSVYKLDRRLCKERARVLRHAKVHYPELLGDQEWLKRIGISDGVPRELSKAGLWLSHVKRESFATLAGLASKPGKMVQKVRASDGRTLVLKTFHLANDTWSGRFYRQVKALAEMRSAYVVRIEGAFMQDAQHGCVIMPYYPGGDLFAWIRDNAHADVATRKRIAIGLLSGLHDLHSRDLVHCDIKPENIFLARGLSPVLGDFDGVQTHDVTMTQPMQATAKYLAPELRNANVERVEPAVDMYSVGMVLKELFQGCQMSQALQNLTTRLTARDPRERPSALVALRHQAFQVEPIQVVACAICLDTFPIAEGVACDDAHFTCKTCLQQAIKAAEEPGGHVQILANGSMKCITPDCDLDISGRTIAAAVPEKVYKVLQKIVRQHTERELARQHERDVQRRVDEALRDHGLDPETQNHLRKIQNEILTMSCPRCSAAFADFDGCCALKCSNNCSCYFCAWCLKDTGNSSQGCHQHVANCPSKRSADPYYADFGTVQEAWAKVRAQRLRQYMTKRIKSGDKRKEVLKKLQPLLTPDIIGARFRL